MKLFLHIGTEKTGTTTIQKTLCENREKLSDKGFYFVQSAGNKNNRKIPAYCMNDGRYDDFFKEQLISNIRAKNAFRKEFLSSFRDEISNLPKHIHSVIISSEHFHSRTIYKEEIESVRSFLEPFFDEIKVICYVREQASTVVSLYSTAIKSGLSVSLKNMILKCNPSNNYFNYYSMLSNWRDIFGAENLIVKVFDEQRFIRNDLVYDFISILSDELIQLISREDKKENESLSLTGQLLGRAINQALPKYDEKGVVNPMNAKVTSKVNESFKGKSQLLSIMEYDDIYESFGPSNLKLFKEFIRDKDGIKNFKYDPPKSSSNMAVLGENDIPKLVDIFNTFLTIPKTLPDSYAVFFRDLAISLEDTDLKSAIKLMELAKTVRPNGPVINKKLQDYKNKVSSSVLVEA